MNLYLFYSHNLTDEANIPRNRALQTIKGNADHRGPLEFHQVIQIIFLVEFTHVIMKLCVKLMWQLSLLVQYGPVAQW